MKKTLITLSRMKRFRKDEDDDDKSHASKRARLIDSPLGIVELMVHVVSPHLDKGSLRAAAMTCRAWHAWLRPFSAAHRWKDVVRASVEEGHAGLVMHWHDILGAGAIRDLAGHHWKLPNALLSVWTAALARGRLDWIQPLANAADPLGIRGLAECEKPTNARSALRLADEILDLSPVQRTAAMRAIGVELNRMYAPCMFDAMTMLHAMMLRATPHPFFDECLEAAHAIPMRDRHRLINILEDACLIVDGRRDGCSVDYAWRLLELAAFYTHATLSYEHRLRSVISKFGPIPPVIRIVDAMSRYLRRLHERLRFVAAFPAKAKDAVASYPPLYEWPVAWHSVPLTPAIWRTKVPPPTFAFLRGLVRIVTPGALHEYVHDISPSVVIGAAFCATDVTRDTWHAIFAAFPAWRMPDDANDIQWLVSLPFRGADEHAEEDEQPFNGLYSKTTILNFFATVPWRALGHCFRPEQFNHMFMNEAADDDLYTLEKRTRLKDSLATRIDVDADTMATVVYLLDRGYGTHPPPVADFLCTCGVCREGNYRLLARPISNTLLRRLT
jgi:hypothetical protein